MLFQKRFHAGIRDGTVTLSFRTWSTARVKVGSRYRVPPTGMVEVDAIDQVPVARITRRDARMAGFEDREELLELLQKHHDGRLTARSRVFRVRFHFTGALEEPDRVATPERVAEVIERLDRMDARSRRGPWTRAVLREIGRRPRVAAARLAPRFQRERLAFKADVRKLKALGLTISHEVGYALTELGEAVRKASGRR